MRYEAILEWNMTAAEAECFRLATQYEKEFIRMFSDTSAWNTYTRNVLPTNGDPRKSQLFKHCWKLRRETKGLLIPQQYRQYIHANFAILKINNARIEPNAICGDKAWIRWKVWERWYQKKQEELDVTLPKHSFAADPKIMKEIDRSKKFVFEQCEGEPTQEKIQKFIDSGVFRLWIMMGKVSPFYITLSPFVGEKCDELAIACSFDPILLRERTTDDVTTYFREEFKHEF